VTVASDWVDLEQAHDLTGERARVMLLLRQVFADRPDMAATFLRQRCDASGVHGRPAELLRDPERLPGLLRFLTACLPA
jgi:hypothetical protein